MKPTTAGVHHRHTPPTPTARLLQSAPPHSSIRRSHLADHIPRGVPTPPTQNTHPSRFLQSAPPPHTPKNTPYAQEYSPRRPDTPLPTLHASRNLLIRVAIELLQEKNIYMYIYKYIIYNIYMYRYLSGQDLLTGFRKCCSACRQVWASLGKWVATKQNPGFQATGVCARQV